MPLVRWVRRKIAEKLGKEPKAGGRDEGLACAPPAGKTPRSKV